MCLWQRFRAGSLISWLVAWHLLMPWGLLIGQPIRRRLLLGRPLLGLLLQLGDLKACSRRLLSRQTPLLLGVAVNILQTWSE